MTENQCDLTAVEKSELQVQTDEPQSALVLLQSKPAEAAAVRDPATICLFGPPAWPPINRW